jgi:hypothetical protein
MDWLQPLHLFITIILGVLVVLVLLRSVRR